MSYLLKNKNLEVIIGAPTEFYNGSRFDLSGNIFQVTLNQKHTFCTTEKNEHLTDFGFGLVNEFDIEEPYSYKKASAGSLFHKIGVGTLLKADNEPYHFYKPYEFTALNYSITVNNEKNEIIFEAESVEINGMKYHYLKTISIDKNQLWVKYALKNSGSKSFKATEYCHNFLSINHLKLDASYRLKSNQPIQPELFIANINTEKVISIEKNEITWKSTPQNDFFIAGLTSSAQKCTGWHLENIAEKAAISEVIDFECTQMNLWGTAHVVSPELFFNVSLTPCQEAIWRRKYTFYDL
jgi:hypothetical protein